MYNLQNRKNFQAMQPTRDWSPEYANSSHNTISEKKKPLSLFRLMSFDNVDYLFKELVFTFIDLFYWFLHFFFHVFLLWSFWSLSFFGIVCLVVYLWFFLFSWGKILLLSTSLLELLLLHCTSVGDIKDLGSIPELERFPGEGNGNPLQYSCLENHKERGVHRVAKIQTQLKLLSTHGFRILTLTLSFVSHIFLFPLWFLWWSISCLIAYCLASMCLCCWQFLWFFSL